MNLLCVASFSFSQELQRSERVHGPFEYYSLKIAKLSSLTVPPLYMTYQCITCQGSTCPEPMKIGISGLVWAATLLAVRKFDENHPKQKEKAECTVIELINLIGSFPDVVENLPLGARDNFIHCPLKETTIQTLSFTIPELEKMFGGYVTLFGTDSNGKPCGELIVEEKAVRHPLITKWAENQHFWKHMC